MINLTTKIVNPIGTTWQDYPDPESLAVIVYFLGCENSCNNCHNPLFKSRGYNHKDYTIKQLYTELFDLCYRSKTKCLILSGGDSLSSLNVEFTKQFVRSYGNIFDICIYTGYNIEYVKLNGIKGFTFIKTGLYDETLKQESIKTDNYFQLASTNQEIYNQGFTLCTRDGRMNF